MGDPYLSILLILISIGGSLAISIPLVRLSPKSRHSREYKEREKMLVENNDMEKYGVYSVNGKRYYKGYEVNNDGRVNMTFSNLFDTECVKAADELEQLKYQDRKRQRAIKRQKRLGVKRYARLKSIGTVLLILALGLVALIGYILPAICVGIGILVALAFMSN